MTTLLLTVTFMTLAFIAPHHLRTHTTPGPRPGTSRRHPNRTLRRRLRQALRRAGHLSPFQPQGHSRDRGRVDRARSGYGGQPMATGDLVFGQRLACDAIVMDVHLTRTARAANTAALVFVAGMLTAGYLLRPDHLTAGDWAAIGFAATALTLAATILAGSVLAPELLDRAATKLLHTRLLRPRGIFAPHTPSPRPTPGTDRDTPTRTHQ
jgi:hypothetical protein